MRALLALLADVSGATRDLRQAEAERGTARQQAAALRVDLAEARQTVQVLTDDLAAARRKHDDQVGLIGAARQRQEAAEAITAGLRRQVLEQADRIRGGSEQNRRLLETQEGLREQIAHLLGERTEQASVLSQVRTDLELAEADVASLSRLKAGAAAHLRAMLNYKPGTPEHRAAEDAAMDWLEAHG